MGQNEKEEIVRKMLQDGAEKVKPLVMDVTSLFMNAYECGFATCFKLFTGQDFKPNEQTDDKD